MVATAGNEHLEITDTGLNNEFGEVKMVPEMGRSLLSIRQMTKNTYLSITFIDNKCMIKKKRNRNCPRKKRR